MGRCLEQIARWEVSKMNETKIMFSSEGDRGVLVASLRGKISFVLLNGDPFDDDVIKTLERYIKLLKYVKDEF